MLSLYSNIGAETSPPFIKLHYNHRKYVTNRKVSLENYNAAIITCQH